MGDQDAGVCLLVLCGLPGAGKTTVIDAIVEAAMAVRQPSESAVRRFDGEEERTTTTRRDNGDTPRTDPRRRGKNSPPPGGGRRSTTQPPCLPPARHHR